MDYLSRCFLFLIAILTAGTAIGQTAATPRSPNVIFILTDDQGSTDVNCYGAHDLITPNMDAIAKRGIRFTQFEAAAPICSPSRAAILTGKYPQRAGLPGLASSLPGGHGMPGTQTTIAELFRSAGYATAHFGKWHLGYVTDEEPNAQGFDESFGFMGGCLDGYSHYFYWVGPNRHDLWHNGTEVYYDGQFLTDLITDDATAFIEKHRHQPFLIYLAMKEPHYPFQGTAKWRERYKDLPEGRREYAASVSTADEHIGIILAKLDELHLRDDTIVCFMSDQGHSCETPSFSGKGGSAGPYRGAKFSLFEGGIRIPAMISWTGHLPENQVRSQMCTGCDWLPTLAGLCGVKLLAPTDLDGRDLLPVIESANAPSQHPMFFWATGQNAWAVRDGDWKLLGNPIDPAHAAPLTKADALFLADLKNDVGERRNVAADHPDVVKKLSRAHLDWVTGLGVDNRANGKGGESKDD